MIPIVAPAGWEGCRVYDDGTRSWQVSVREVGDTWWTTVGLVGHAHSHAPELDERAAAAIVSWLRAHGKAAT